MDQAIQIAIYFKNANNKYFIGQLRDQQKILYKKYYSIVVPSETRWNSYYQLVTSLLRTKKALEVY